MNTNRYLNILVYCQIIFYNRSRIMFLLALIQDRAVVRATEMCPTNPTCKTPDDFVPIPDYCGPDYYICINCSPYVQVSYLRFS